MSELILESDLSLLNDRILNLGAGLATMPETGTMQVSKAFLAAILGYMEELLGMRRAKPANDPLTLEQLREHYITCHDCTDAEPSRCRLAMCGSGVDARSINVRVAGRS